jgi:hypothetical protein
VPTVEVLLFLIDSLQNDGANIWLSINQGIAINQGLVLSIKILRSEKFSEKVRKFKTYRFCQKGQKNYLANVMAWLAY